MEQHSKLPTNGGRSSPLRCCMRASRQRRQVFAPVSGMLVGTMPSMPGGSSNVPTWGVRPVETAGAGGSGGKACAVVAAGCGQVRVAQ